MVFKTTEYNGGFTKISFEDNEAKEAFASFAREVHPQSEWFNSPERFWCSIGIFNSIKTKRELIRFAFAGIEAPRSNPATRKLLKRIYQYYKTQQGEDAKFIKASVRRLMYQNKVLP